MSKYMNEFIPVKDFSRIIILSRVIESMRNGTLY